MSESLPGYDEWKLRGPDDENSQDEQCPICGGSGAVEGPEHFVTHDMAMDAGIPELEGDSLGAEWNECPRCGGTGYDTKTSNL